MSRTPTSTSIVLVLVLVVHHYCFLTILLRISLLVVVGLVPSLPQAHHMTNIFVIVLYIIVIFVLFIFIHPRQHLRDFFFLYLFHPQTLTRFFSMHLRILETTLFYFIFDQLCFILFSTPRALICLLSHLNRIFFTHQTNSCKFFSSHAILRYHEKR